MTSMGFGNKWITACLKSASVSILVNGSPTNEFMVEVRKDKIGITHLQYADDTMFFVSWNKRNVKNLMKILKCFELASGLHVNFQKSTIYGVGVSNEVVQSIAQRFNCQVCNLPFTYLGIPIGSSMKKFEDWKPIIERFNNRLSDWKARAISFGGRELERVRKNFFWGGGTFDRKVAWVKWVNVCLPFEKGGLNIGSLDSKNLALLGKWRWHFHVESNSLWTKVIKSLYGLNGGFNVDSSRQLFPHCGTWQDIIFAAVALTSGDGALHLMRNSLVPKKLKSSYGEQDFEREELDKRGLDLHSVLCPLCNDVVESEEHSLILCKYAMEVWNRVFANGGISRMWQVLA
ncbi:uncharacterized protein [Rutidosis leptorrhynchoides]|uniref:uncharacterized protein n=1 Tax=Rutidosis leptorrhynchoides TaxID=125765 RepID=UPI003A9A0198